MDRCHLSSRGPSRSRRGADLKEIAHCVEAGVQASRSGAEFRSVDTYQAVQFGEVHCIGVGSGEVEAVEQTSRRRPRHRFAADALVGQELVRMLLERRDQLWCEVLGEVRDLTPKGVVGESKWCASSAGSPLSRSNRKHRAILARIDRGPGVAVSRQICARTLSGSSMR